MKSIKHYLSILLILSAISLDQYEALNVTVNASTNSFNDQV